MKNDPIVIGIFCVLLLSHGNAQCLMTEWTNEMFVYSRGLDDLMMYASLTSPYKGHLSIFRQVKITQVIVLSNLKKG